MDEATRCDRLLLMRDGGMLADDTPAGLLATTGAADTGDRVPDADRAARDPSCDARPDVDQQPPTTDGGAA